MVLPEEQRVVREGTPRKAMSLTRIPSRELRLSTALFSAHAGHFEV